jgi:hypothetical protein
LAEVTWIRRRLFARGDTMDTTTLLIIVIVVLLLGGGGWYGRGRWF